MIKMRLVLFLNNGASVVLENVDKVVGEKKIDGKLTYFEINLKDHRNWRILARKFNSVGQKKTQFTV